MRLLFLSYEYPPIGGGGGMVCKQLAHQFSENLNHQVVVVTTHFTNLPEEFVQHNLTVYRLKTSRKKAFKSNPFEMLNWAQAAKKFCYKLFLQQSFDSVLAHFVRPGGDVALYLNKHFKVPYIVVSHGHDIPWVKPYFLYVLHAFSIPQIKLIVKNSSHLVLLSQALKNNASRFFGESITSKLAVISNGANGQLLPINFVKPQNKILIGFIGRLTQQKNLKLALKALSMVKSCNWQLHVFGDGPQLKNLTSCYAKLIEHKKVVFHGFTKHNQILQFLQKSKLLLITSQSEGFSLVALEAAIKQNYILSTQVSGIDFIEKYNIGKILPNSPKIFAQAIDDFLQNQPNLPTRSIAENIASDFSWQKVATAYQNLLFKSIKPKL